MQLNKVFRLAEWKNSHLLLIVIGYVFFSLQNHLNSGSFYKNFIYLFISALFVGSYGYYINDLFDIDQDEKVGKKNFASKHSPLLRFFIVFFLLLATCIFWFLMNRNLTILFLLITEILLLFLYAVPKIRIKERVWLSIVFDSMYAYVIWGFIVLKLTETDFGFTYFCYLFWLFLFGLRGILTHQISDFTNDLITHTTTTATQFGVEKVQVFQKFIIPPIELIFFFFFLFAIHPLFNLLYGLYLVISIQNGELFPKWDRNRYLKTEKDLVAKFTENFYFSWLPFFAAIALVSVDLRYIYFVIGFVLLFANQFLNVLSSLSKFVTPIYYYSFGLASYFVNHTLYYSCLIFGIDLKERASKRKKNVSIEKQYNTEEKVITQNSTLVLNKINEKKVNSLWIGEELSNMELLTIHSFLHHGFEFHLWLYQQLNTVLPPTVVIHDANEIIPFNQVFSYQNASQFGIGKGSFAGFSDVFRYKLLYEKGGWWVDMDVTCLKPFDVESDYFFRAHHELEVVGNVMKAPQFSSLMLKCYKQALELIDEKNTDWYKPILILNENIKSQGLTSYVFHDLSNTDEFQKIESYYFGSEKIPEKWCFFHWGNEVLRNYQLNKRNSFYESSYSRLLREYKLIEPSSNLVEFDQRFRRELFIANIKKML